MLTLPEGFRSVRTADGRVWILRDVFPGEPNLERWDRWLDGREGDCVTAGGGRAPAKVVLLPGVGGVVIRRYFHGGLFAPWTRDLFWGTRRPLAEVGASERIRDKGVKTPEILGVYLRRVVGRIYRGCLLTRRIPGGENLREWVGEEGRRPESWTPVLREVARAVALLHRAGCLHRDLNLSNLVLSSAGVWILDLDGARVRASLSLGEQASTLLRLYRSLRKETGRTEPLDTRDRLLFLKHYAEGDRRLFRSLASQLNRRRRLNRLLHPLRRR